MTKLICITMLLNGYMVSAYVLPNDCLSSAKRFHKAGATMISLFPTYDFCQGWVS